MQSESTKVLFLHPALAPYRVDLFNAVGERCRAHVSLLMDNLPDQKLDQATLRARLKVPFEVHSGPNAGAPVALAAFCRTQIRNHAPDVVVTSEFGIASAVAAASHYPHGCNPAHVIWTDDNPESVMSDSWYRRLARRLHLQTINGLITISEGAEGLYRQRYRFGGPVAHCPIIHSESEFRTRLSQGGHEAKNLISRHSLGGRRVLLFVGRLAPEKGLDLLLPAARPILAKFSDVVLVLVGDGPLDQHLKALATQLGIADRVILAGHAEGNSLMGWYQIGAALVLPSRLERFGAVVNEALLAGLPVVCSKFAGATTLIRESSNGTIVDPNCRDDLTNALEWAIVGHRHDKENFDLSVRPSLMPFRFSDIIAAMTELLTSVSVRPTDKERQPL